jgi:hypothetical protein
MWGHYRCSVALSGELTTLEKLNFSENWSDLIQYKYFLFREKKLEFAKRRKINECRVNRRTSFFSAVLLCIYIQHVPISRHIFRLPFSLLTRMLHSITETDQNQSFPCLHNLLFIYARICNSPLSNISNVCKAFKQAVSQSVNPLH